MNILPKKKWHVRTKENMARVRKDEKAAAEEEKKQLERALLAENESRLSILRQRADERTERVFGASGGSWMAEEGGSGVGGGKHVNLFADLEREERKLHGTSNKEYEEEKKKETDEYEIKMGIKVALGGGSTEREGKGMWYEQLPMRRGEEKKEEVKEGEKGRKERRRRTRTSSSSSSSSSSSHKKGRKKERKKKSEKHPKKKKKKRSKEDTEVEERAKKERRLQQLREERVQREREEAARTLALLHPQKIEQPATKKPRYNSQFNPHLLQ